MSSKPSDRPDAPGKVAIIGLLGLLANLPYRLQLHTGINDEALVIQAGRRMLEGQIPYRDFDLLYPPGSMALTALWMGIGGETMASARWLMLLVGGALTALVYLISCRLVTSRMRYLPALLFAASGYSEWPVLSYHWFAILGLLLSLHQLLLWFEGGAERYLIGAGVACGLSALCLQSDGVATCLAGLLAATCCRSPVEGVSKLRRGALFLAGVTAVWLPFVLFLTATGSLFAFIDNAVLRVLGGLYKYHGAPYDLSKHVIQNWLGLGRQWPTVWGGAQLAWAAQSVTMVTVWTIKYALLFPIMLSAAWLGYRRGQGTAALSIFLILWTLVVRERLDLLYTNYLTPLWYIALVLCLEALLNRYRKPGRALTSAVVLLFSGTLVLGLQSASAYRYPVLTSAGPLWSNSPPVAAWQQQLYRQALDLTPPGASTFAWPYAPSFYVLARTRNATRCDFLVSGWQTPEQVRTVADALTKVDYLYHFPLDPALLADYPHLDPVQFQRQNEEFLEILTAGHEEFARVGPVVLYRRRP